MTIVDPADCPFPDLMLARRFAFEGIPLTEAELARCLKARRRPVAKLLERVTVKCSPTSGALPEGMRPAHPVRARHHVEMLFAGRRVHIEAIVQELSSPGGLNKEIRVYVGGVLEGRSILLGRLGASVNSFPLVATIGSEAAGSAKSRVGLMAPTTRSQGLPSTALRFSGTRFCRRMLQIALARECSGNAWSIENGPRSSSIAFDRYDLSKRVEQP